VDFATHLKKMNFVKNNVRVSVLALLAMSSAGAASLLLAQQQPAPPPTQQQSGNPHRQRGFAHELTHETREAAGEENDEKVQFKESPSVQFIARHTGLSNGHAYLLSVLLNFAVVAGLIFWAAYKYLPKIFNARTAGIQKAMQEAQKASEEARRRLAEIESRLMKLDVEIGMMRDSAEREAAAEEARIQATAREDARKIIESSHHEIAAAAKAARRALTAYAADLAVGLAKKQIQVDSGTDHTLVRNFAGELSTYSGAPDALGKDGH
jgi:F-type H+-transporting ATPase subunit b